MAAHVASRDVSIDAGKAYLEANKEKEGVITLESGLQACLSWHVPVLESLLAHSVAQMRAAVQGSAGRWWHGASDKGNAV